MVLHGFTRLIGVKTQTDLHCFVPITSSMFTRLSTFVDVRVTVGGSDHILLIQKKTNKKQTNNKLESTYSGEKIRQREHSDKSCRNEIKQ